MTGVPALDLLFLSLAAVAAGFVNALAGGGTLIVFPALIAAGLPPIVANVSSTLALSPGYLSATLAQRRDLEGQGRRLALLLPIATVGGGCGAQLLLHGSDATFNTVVPWLILLSCGTYGNVIRFLVPLTAGNEIVDEGLAILTRVFDRLAV